MKKIGVGLVLFALVITPAAAGFRVGIVSPIPVPAADSTALGSSMQRYQLAWHGEASYEGTLALAPDTEAVLSVSLYGDYNSRLPTTQAERNVFGGWLRSILARYPQVKNVIVGNEIGRAWWYEYPALLATVSPIIRAYGARVIGPGAHPVYPVSSQLALVEAIAQAGPHLLDAWDEHGYWTDIPLIVAQVRKAFGWKIPIWVSEDGAESQPAAEFAHLYYGTLGVLWGGGLSEQEQAAVESSQMITAYCAGVSRWFSFELYDMSDLRWFQTGLSRPDGSHKPAFAAFASTSRAIDDGLSCPRNLPAPPPPTRTRWDVVTAARLAEVGSWAFEAYVA